MISSPTPSSPTPAAAHTHLRCSAKGMALLSLCIFLNHSVTTSSSCSGSRACSTIVQLHNIRSAVHNDYLLHMSFPHTESCPVQHPLIHLHIAMHPLVRLEAVVVGNLPKAGVRLQVLCELSDGGPLCRIPPEGVRTLGMWNRAKGKAFRRSLRFPTSFLSTSSMIHPRHPSTPPSIHLSRSPLSHMTRDTPDHFGPSQG